MPALTRSCHEGGMPTVENLSRLQVGIRLRLAPLPGLLSP
jgi:hypothetical protein